MKKKILIPAIALVLGAGVVFGGSQALAFESGSVRGALVEKLAQKFGKSPAEVQAVFDEIRVEHQEEMKAKFEKRLSGAVAAGTLTEEQKQLIMQKHQEMMDEHELSAQSKQSLTQEERHVERLAARDELESWAQENNIDLSFFKGPDMNRPHRRAGR
jgi:hypothetical protein